MEIRNEVKQKDKEVEKKKFVVRNAADVQRAKLEKLMKNPDKPVIIPGPGKNRDFSTAVPSFVRNVMGSSAGAGSGEFHVYRHLRRKEYARQKQIQEKSHSEQLDDAFQEKLENNRKVAEERTAKKRAKRLKKKAKQKTQRGKKPKLSESGNDLSEGSSDESEGEENEEASAQSEDSKGATENDNKTTDQTKHPNENSTDTAEKESDLSKNKGTGKHTDEGTEYSSEKTSSPTKTQDEGEPMNEAEPHRKEGGNDEKVEN
uniref:PRKR-interacting protein 1 n=1 Tax=Anopheles christyi TaxID=43041 RepID=A0A182JQA9_9DIPT